MGIFNVNRGTITDWLYQTVSGAELSEEALEQIEKASIKKLAVKTAVGLIADLVSGCDIEVVEDGKAVHNSTWYTLNYSANPNETSAQLISKWISRMYYKGDAILVPIAKNLYCPDSYNVDSYAVKGDVYSGVCIGDFQSNQKFRADRVYCLRQTDPQIKGLIDSAYVNYAELMEYAKKAYKQGSGEKYAVNLGARASGSAKEHEEYLDNVNERMSKFINAESAAFPLNRDQSIQRLSAAGTTSVASDYPALRKEVYSLVSEVLHLPAGLLEGNITSVDQIVNEMLTFTIDPLVNTMNQELTRKTYSPVEIMDRGCHIRIDTTSIKHIDVMDMANNIDKLISSGFMSIDEVRGLCDAAEINADWSQRHYITKNYEDIEKGGE